MERMAVALRSRRAEVMRAAAHDGKHAIPGLLDVQYFCGVIPAKGADEAAEFKTQPRDLSPIVRFPFFGQ